MATAKSAASDNVAKLKKQISDKELSTLYLFYGEEKYLLEYYLGCIKKQLIDEAFEAFNYHVFDGKQVNVQELYDSVNALPAFSEKSMILIRDLEMSSLDKDAPAALATVLSDIPEYCCVVIVCSGDQVSAMKKNSDLKKMLSLYANVVEFAKQGERELSNWIRRRFKVLGKDISPDLCTYLIQITDGTMNSIMMEIEKVAAYSSRDKVTKNDIDAVVVPLTETLIYQLTGAIAERKYGKAIELLNDMFNQKYDPTPLLAAIGKSIRQLYAAKLLINDHKGKKELMDMTGMKSYPAELMLQYARNVSLDWCRKAVVMCAETDRDLKTLPGDRNAMLERMIINLYQESTK